MSDAIETLLISPYRKRYQDIADTIENNQRRLELINSLSTQFSTKEVDSLIDRVQKQVDQKKTTNTEKQRTFKEQSLATYTWMNDLLNVFILIFVVLIVLYGVLAIFFKMDMTSTQQQVSGFPTFWDVFSNPFIRKDDQELNSVSKELSDLRKTVELESLKKQLNELRKTSGSSGFFSNLFNFSAPKKPIS